MNTTPPKVAAITLKENELKVEIDGVTYVPAAPVCANASPLDVRKFVGDLDRECTLREYLHELVSTMWREGEGFSGKRPFGNSGWEYDVYEFLIVAGAVKGELDENGRYESCDKEQANLLMPGLIAAAFDLAS